MALLQREVVPVVKTGPICSTGLRVIFPLLNKARFLEKVIEIEDRHLGGQVLCIVGWLARLVGKLGFKRAVGRTRCCCVYCLDERDEYADLLAEGRSSRGR